MLEKRPMKKIGIILTPDARSKAYLQKIIANKIRLDEFIFMNDGRLEDTYTDEEKNAAIQCGFDISESVTNTLKKHGVIYREFNFVDINHASLTEYLKKSEIDFYIFTGGGILKKEVLASGPRFIHIHPGIVPQYRGSTCFYYSIINEDQCGVTVFIMDEGLDTGPVVYQQTFPKPNNIFIDQVYDSHIRSESLIQVLKNNMLQKEISTSKVSDGNTYFIIHPVLKHVAILRCIKD